MSPANVLAYAIEVAQSLILGVWDEYRNECLMYLVFMIGFLGCRLLAAKRLPLHKADKTVSEEDKQADQTTGGVRRLPSERMRARLAPLEMPPRGVAAPLPPQREPPVGCPPGPPATDEDEPRPPPPAFAPPPPPVALSPTAGAPKTATQYSALIQAAGRVGNAPEALRLLSELEQQLPGATDTHAWNCALEACVANGSHSAAQQLLVRMVCNGRADVVSYNTYLKVVLAKGDRKEADMLLEEMRRSGHGPSTATFNSMIKDAVGRMDMQRAWQILDDMEKADISPDVITCSVLLRGIKHSACPEDLDRLFSFVQRSGLPPDQALINSLLDAGSRTKDADRLAQLLDVLRPSSVVASHYGQGALIRAYGQVRCSDGAWAVWRDFTATCAAGPEDLANGRTVSAAMVDACLACEDLDGAAAVFREVHDCLPEYSPLPTAFVAFARACLRHQQPQLAVSVYEEVKEGLECDNAGYAALADALVRQRRMEQAMGLLRDMACKGVSPDAGIYCLLIRGHCSRGNLEEALQLLGQAQRRGLKPDAPLYHTVIEACARKQMRTLTEQVFQDMQRASIRPSSATLLTLVRLYGALGDLPSAFAAVDDFQQRYDVEPREIGLRVYECLLSACIAGDDPTRALEARDRMLELGYVEDNRTFQALLNLCERRGDSTNAEKLQRRAA